MQLEKCAKTALKLSVLCWYFNLLKYKYKWCPDLESNQGHRDFQSLALPTELSGQRYD